MKRVLIVASVMLFCVNAYADAIEQAERSGCTVVGMTDSESGLKTFITCPGEPGKLPIRGMGDDRKNDVKCKDVEKEQARSESMDPNFNAAKEDCLKKLNEAVAKLCPMEPNGPGKPSVQCTKNGVDGICASTGAKDAPKIFFNQEDPQTYQAPMKCRNEKTICGYGCVKAQGCAGAVS